LTGDGTYQLTIAAEELVNKTKELENQELAEVSRSNQTKAAILGTYTEKGIANM